jgi:competence protein ComGC
MATNNRDKAFSSIEMMAVMCVVTVMMAFLVTISASVNSGSKIARMEAEDAAMWIQEKMLAAQLNESEFSLYLHEITGTRDLMMRIIWNTGPSKGRTETYRMTAAHMGRDSLSQMYMYDGKWITMTPSLKFAVRPPNPSDSAPFFLTVSGLGFTSVRGPDL